MTQSPAEKGRSQVVGVSGRAAKGATWATIVLALIGVGISGVIASVHWNLQASAGYASFCNVNESVNCDVVLSSSYAYFLGVPVAWWAALTYVSFIAGGLLLRRTRRTARRRLATLLFAAAAWSLVFSLFLAYVAIAELEAVCLLCGGLYLVNAGLFVSTWMLLGAVRLEGTSRKSGASWQGRTRWVIGAVATMVVAFIAFAGWEATSNPAAMTAEEIAQRNPEFYRWYMERPVVAVDVPGGHAKGGAGDVVIVEFSDFECAHCAKAYRTLKRVLPRFGNDVQLRFHHYPLSSACNPSVGGTFHPYACLAASAAECAAAQDRFWPYHDLLFENQSSLDRDSLIGYAEEIGLDRARFVACLGTETPRQAITLDVAEAERLGVESTPTFFINGRTIPGALSAEKFEAAIRLERAL